MVVQRPVRFLIVFLGVIASVASGQTTTTTTLPPDLVTVTLVPARDGTLYEQSGDVANGAGQHLFAGATNDGSRRRALLSFDVAGAVPAGAPVYDVVLTMYVSRTRAVDQTVGLHRVLADWGEGASNAAAEEGSGVAAAVGDATWSYRSYATDSWATSGGDIDPTASAETVVGAEGAFYAWSSPRMATEVQAWVDGTTDNFGWLLLGNEVGTRVTKRFDSRENLTASQWPRLTIRFQGTGSTTSSTTTSSTTTTTQFTLAPFVDPLPRPAIAQPVAGVPGAAASYRLAMRETVQQLHRDLPPTRVWGFGDGSTGATYPGPTIEATRGQAVTVTWVNDLRDASGALRTTHLLPVDPCPHGAHDPTPRTVVHLHGAHAPAEFDGYPESTLLPGEEAPYTYPNQQLPATMWYHDHALGITRLNVYLGLAGLYLLRDAEERALALPAGEYEVPLVIQDRKFNLDGSLQFPAEWQEHFHGDTTLVNGKVWPYLEVKRGKYRLRLLNGSGSRTYTLALSNGAAFTVIGSDGGLLPGPVTRTELTLGPAERSDVVVDFAGEPGGTAIRLINSAPAPFPGPPGVGVVPNVMEFRVIDLPGETAALPAALRALESIPESAAVRTREFLLRKGDDTCTGQRWSINGLRWDDITEFPELGTAEIWSFVNPSGMMHPMHMHLTMFQVLDRQPFTLENQVVVPTGSRVPPPAEEAAWKDTVRVAPGEIVRVIARFTDYKGRFAYHCHILEHEDHEMMRQFQTVQCGDGELDPGEACDDGNTLDGDGCASNCRNGPRLLRGAALLLTDSTRPAERRLHVVSTDGGRLDPEPDGTADAELRVAAVGGDGFDATYPLPAAGWRAIEKKGRIRAFRFRARSGAIRRLTLRIGKRLEVQGRGRLLTQSLRREPTVVQIELRLGAQQFCLEFGGRRGRYVRRERLRRLRSPSAPSCPAARGAAPGTASGEGGEPDHEHTDQGDHRDPE
jgi:cysteine-rich repeat protein